MDRIKASAAGAVAAILSSTAKAIITCSELEGMSMSMGDQVTALEGMGVDTDVVEGSMWRHRKGGHYKVLAVGRIESDLSPVVVYQSQKDWLVWVRPLAEFEDGRFDEIPAEE